MITAITIYLWKDLRPKNWKQKTQWVLSTIISITQDIALIKFLTSFYA